MVPRSELVVSHHYAGKGRNANVGLWDGHRFVTTCKKFDVWVTKYEGYWEKDGGCFRPLMDITQLLQQCSMIESVAAEIEEKK